MLISKNEVINKLPASQIVDHILVTGIKSGANFIHIEPTIDAIEIKFRLNGSLIKSAEISKKRLKSITEKIKSLANISIDHSDVLSSGRFKYKSSAGIYDIRVYLLPTINGEKLTLQIHNDLANIKSLQELGFWGDAIDIINETIEQKNGLILVTGPNDSGKSSTIISLINGLSNKGLNISTLEDPVEYKIPGTSQIQINQKTNLTFANGISILLKQDVDIIMVSELVETDAINKTLDIAAHKKLIISSMHTDSSAATITKLLDYGASPSALAYNLKIIINQRLVKRLCPDCKKNVVPTKEILDQVNQVFALNKSVNINYVHDLELNFHSSKNKVTKAKDLMTSENKLKKVWIANPKGCDNCMNSGYKGRIVVYEILKNTANIKNLIVAKSNTANIYKQAFRDGMINYLVDCLLKSLAGETSIDEAIRLAKDGHLA
jgi:type II secretory ATPase GspE/PulE/Tfp pilus assembly ATPase PilB-like protein